MTTEPPAQDTGPTAQINVLARAFVTRFFDNEVTGGSNDLKTTFFWMLAFLATPGFLLPFLMAFDWTLIARFQGPEVLREVTRTDKTLYLVLGMVASGLVAAITWNSLLLDRRDGLILGTLPVSAWTIVAAKLVALAIYIGIVAVGMHALGAVSFGFSLATLSSFMFLIRSVLAHFLASVAASFFVFLAVAGAQGAALALSGPGLFRRISPVLQVLLVATVVIGFTEIPRISESVIDTLAGQGQDNRPWILLTPPLWFLGTYEWILGTHDPVLLRLHRWAAIGLGAVAALALLTYPLAYRRLSASAVEAGDARRTRRVHLAERFTQLLSRRPAVRAAAQFFLASIGRVERLRFVIAAAVGFIAAWVIPTLIYWLPGARAAAGPRSEILALSLAALIFLLLGLRIAIAMPADLRASWLIATAEAPGAALRSGVWKGIFLVGVIPVVAAFTPLYWWSWGIRVAVLHALVLLAFGTVLVEVLLWRMQSMPCTQPWRPEGVNLRKWWPAYLAGFSLLTLGLAAIEVRSFHSARASATLIGTFLLLALAVRVGHRRRDPVHHEEIQDALDAPHVLDLN